MNITITVANQYGNEVYKPACDTAQTFCNMLGTKTLTPLALMYIKRLGYTINVQQKTPMILSVLDAVA